MPGNESRPDGAVGGSESRPDGDAFKQRMMVPRHWNREQGIYSDYTIHSDQAPHSPGRTIPYTQLPRLLHKPRGASLVTSYTSATRAPGTPAPGPRRPGSPPSPSGTLLSAGEIDARYREYIFSYNEGATHPVLLPRLWSNAVSFNGKQLPVDLAVVLLGKILLPVIAGLKYQIEEVAVDEGRQQIAVRLSLEGVPENDFLQKGGPGEKVKVYEHAFYGYEDGKISWGWAAQAFDTLPPPAPGAGGP
ncbi:hypothetical protein CSHISOI_06442 [Colletotrichum shisoi]|uniref:Uncharacterized protein n=1 Tax=Colletotrichum shisoi TaxID=2078593 RepID=A0A5Q4BQG4_9PEZI|nr:hypothetical protein CSHISOI_06442 [Colletotrichum shisoi]